MLMREGDGGKRSRLAEKRYALLLILAESLLNGDGAIVGIIWDF